ncbi:hypothetical protein C462_00617 [Halorubrum distributum JCM 13916]|uniref:Uncharacterized protein n=1 Tax=Halorubrum distributum JCM 13916 TaxID=1230455 RepID=M0PSU8_9EURY|nr:hypothetical protein C462_00617 [Halorubrum arcis JCM 13916]
MAADKPTRGADRNLGLADQADPATDEMLLPSLDDVLSDEVVDSAATSPM